MAPSVRSHGAGPLLDLVAEGLYRVKAEERGAKRTNHPRPVELAELVNELTAEVERLRAELNARTQDAGR